jgi:3-dehydrosphinganine reductase
MKINSPQNKVVVITGGSSGIGFSTAELLLEKGAIVCLVARTESKLKEAAAELKQKNSAYNVQYYACDVMDPAQVNETIKKIVDQNKGIDWLINNAGIGETGRFESQPLEVMHKVMNTNYWGPVNVTLAALPYLRKSQGAAIAFVSSVAGYVGLFGYTHYVPSKFAITGLAECLRMEFNDYNIPVTLVYPPDTQTPMLEKEQANTLDECKALSGNAKVVQPDAVAVKFVNGIMKGKFEVYCNGESKLVRVLRGLAPGILFSEVDGIVKKSRKRAAKEKLTN